MDLSVLQEMRSSGEFHLYTNTVVGFFYLVVFWAVLKNLIASNKIRNIFSFSVASLFLLNAFLFLGHGIFGLPAENFLLQIVGWMIALLPGFIFVYMRSKGTFALSPVEQMPSSERFDKLKHEFLTVASHELRTPLSVINGFAEILVREKLGPLNDEQKRRVRKILLQGQRLNHIIDELLDLSRIRSGKVEVRRDVFAIIPVLKACLDDHRIVCEQQGLRLQDNLPDMLPDVIGDLERVTQVVVNLLNNAIKYTEPGGVVSMSAKYEKDRNRIFIHVTDTGIGIDREDLRRVFEEFYRASQKHVRKYTGTGLGLAIVKQLVESQGGEVGVSSEGLDRGSDFYFSLPVSKTPSLASGRETKPLSQSRSAA